MFNLIMIIFPEGKTQKFCRISIKIFIMIYLLDNILLNRGIDIGVLENIPSYSSSYEREVSIQNVDQDFIDQLNKDNYAGEEVIKNIELNFNDKLNIEAKITTNKLLSVDKANELKKDIAEIFNISSDNINVISGGIYE